MLKFRRKQSAVELLEELENDIKKYEKNKEEIQLNERKYVGALVLYSIVIYLASALLCFAYLMPNNLIDPIKSIIPLLLIPFVLYFMRRFMKWFYHKRVNHYQSKLNIFKEKKKKIIEEVKEKEPYKRAREILDRFSEDEAPLSSSSSSLLNQTIKQASSPQSLNRTISQSLLATPRQANNPRALYNDNLIQNTHAKPMPPSVLTQQIIPRTPRPILSQSRTTLDKLMDMFIGEGPSNRYALICKSCCSHNGMALKEEFEYLAYKCAYCGVYNAARKQKLRVPNSSLADLTILHQKQQQMQQEQQHDESKSNTDIETDVDSLRASESGDMKPIEEKKNE